MSKADIGIYGLGVMGASLALNFEEKGYPVAVYNRTVTGKEEDVVASFLEKHGKEKKFIGASDETDFVDSLRRPRKILLMVKAGKAVDAVIESLLPKLEAGDILVDGGNSHYKDTIRRTEQLEQQQIHFIGMGVSGGEEGARNGPSLMPGGSAEGWQATGKMLQSIAARDSDDKPCCAWVGSDGAGHFVKMVHNGIEYADMQLIAECYHLMKTRLDMPAEKISGVFEDWNRDLLNSFLLEITADILKVKADDGSPLIDKILDAAGQKGTGLWTSISALESGTPLPVITSAVNARIFSSFKELRSNLSEQLEGPALSDNPDKQEALKNLEDALLAGRLITLAEGFFLIKQIADEHGWDIDLAEVARIWQNGCIIRSELLKPVRESFLQDAKLNHLLAVDKFSELLNKTDHGLRNIATLCIQSGIPCPAISNALTTYDSLQSGWLPANMIQAQRDYFGAHTYERTDTDRGTFFHTDWNQETEKSE